MRQNRFGKMPRSRLARRETNVIEPLEARRLLSTSGFDTDGWSEITFGRNVDLSPGPMVHQADGKLVVLLSIVPQKQTELGLFPASSHDYGVGRFNADGTLDTTFGDDGFVQIDFSGGDDWASDLAVQPDGKIVVTGLVLNGPGSRTVTGIARLNPDGSLDDSFGQGGLVSDRARDAGDTSNGIVAQQVAVTGDGHILTFGRVIYPAERAAIRPSRRQPIHR